MSRELLLLVAVVGVCFFWGYFVGRHDGRNGL